jgi:hypothetical protein
VRPLHLPHSSYDTQPYHTQPHSRAAAQPPDPHARPLHPLLQIHWLRVILDEGHALGASLGLTNRLALACNMLAERRWVMTGARAPCAPAPALRPGV